MLFTHQIWRGTPGELAYSTGSQGQQNKERGNEEREEGFPNNPGNSSLERALPHHGKGSNGGWRTLCLGDQILPSKEEAANNLDGSSPHQKNLKLEKSPSPNATPRWVGRRSPSPFLSLTNSCSWPQQAVQTLSPPHFITVSCSTNSASIGGGSTAQFRRRALEGSDLSRA